MKNLFALFFSLIIGHLAVSQNDEKTKVAREILEPKVTFELGLRAVGTQGDFRVRYPDGGMIGVGTAIIVPVSKNFPLDFGIDGAVYFMSGTESYTSFDPLESTSENQKFKTTVVGTMLPFHIVMRAYPLKHTQARFQPYAQALFGGKIFAVEEKTEFDIEDTKVKAFSKTKTNVNSSLSYGFGLGAKLRISTNNLLYLNFRVDQLFGEEVKYIDATQAKLDKEGNYTSVYHFSKTDILQIGIGLHLMIE